MQDAQEAQIDRPLTAFRAAEKRYKRPSPAAKIKSSRHADLSEAFSQLVDFVDWIFSGVKTVVLLSRAVVFVLQAITGENPSVVPNRKSKQEREQQDNEATCLPDMLDFRRPESIAGLVQTFVVQSEEGGPDQLLHELHSHPGFFFAPRVIEADERRSFLLDLCGPLLEPPATTSLTALYGQLQGLWRASEQDMTLRSPLPPAPQRLNASDSADMQAHIECIYVSDRSQPAPLQDAVVQSENIQLPLEPAMWASCGDGNGFSAHHLLRKLKWATIGPRYDWTNRLYDRKSPYRRLPDFAAAAALRISRLIGARIKSSAAAAIVTSCPNGPANCSGRLPIHGSPVSEVNAAHPAGFSRPQPQSTAGTQNHGVSCVHDRNPSVSVVPSSSYPADEAALVPWHSSLPQQNRPFVPDAALVCFYRAGDTLCGHQDDAEADVSQPIVSVSLGCSAVLLLGGDDRSTQPLALLLRHGDAAVFTGDARRYYHGVPRVFSDGAAAARDAAALGLPTSISDYLRHTRINISIRASC